MTDPTEAIRKALESFDGGSLLIPVEQLRALLDRLDSAERDQRRYQWLKLWDKTCGFDDDAIDRNIAIDAALRVGAVGEQKEST